MIAPFPAQQRYILTYYSSDLSQFECKAHFKKFKEVELPANNAQSECETNNPENYKKKCSYNSGSGTTLSSCNDVDRYRDDGDETFVHFFGIDKCNSLLLSGDDTEKSKKKMCLNSKRR